MITPNGPNVLSEVYEEEVVIVNLHNGCYYSIQGTGVVIWQAIMEGADSTTIIQAMQSLYDGDAKVISSATVEFLMALSGEHLTCSSDGTGAFVPPVKAKARLTFVPPSYEKFTDMEDLFLLDPVHDVDETGWPNQASPDRHGGALD